MAKKKYKSPASKKKGQPTDKKIGTQGIDSLRKALSGFLKYHRLEDKLTLSMLESVIWNATDHNELVRVIGLITPHLDKTPAEEFLKMMMGAWNNFPHAKLDGFSPHDLSMGLKQPSQTPPAEIKTTVSTILSPALPAQTELVELDEHLWGWRFSESHHKARESFLELQGSDVDFDEYFDSVLDLLQQSPFLFEAVVDVASQFSVVGATDIAYKLFKKAVQFAEEYFPRGFAPGVDQLHWSYLDNRPFLTLLGEYAGTMMFGVGKKKEAIKMYEKLLLLNPNDNQGNREILATAYLKSRRLMDVIRLSDQYPEDMIAEVAMGRVLALIKLHRVDEAYESFKVIYPRLSATAKEIAKQVHKEPRGLDVTRVTIGGVDQAWFYWEAQGEIWEKTPGAQDLVRQWIKNQR